ncbi:bifunctional [glutamine synthetase] adenylyltransferase/[glutamine synthetase]-adenylyl-L-tyrosine phosphorylase [Polycladidibacter hongkongensis]|uniref:bifunctional [glutamine synthetase] adenylyltransferase/[glutamine synthetase]-adenylyl-L-tyrosine phosphorylase n=1 Tax=Polycladidibacter hongkongensis TaxID=1647556 RepID=UPI0008364895|nr:bifunctional [glutamine synthetase] adenylyltransferase/[glutamine synthetase]-adenylyl-L-tyrosine phosphorylase [Pseudovibrio hongkongensis]
MDAVLQPLVTALKVIPAPSSPLDAKEALAALHERLSDMDLQEQYDALCAQNPALPDFLAGVMSNAPFLRQIARRCPQDLLAALGSTPQTYFDQVLTHVAQLRPQTEAELLSELRRAKQQIALAAALADIAGASPLLQVTETLARLADVSLNACIRFCLRDLQRRGKFTPLDEEEPEKASGFFILAMGKHGAGELNYSSDIDLIVLYDPERCLLKDPMEAPVEYVRMTRRLIKMMSDRTGDGYVFRTDLRLRPDPGATPLAISVPAALVYYESLGQNWERAALIKARTCAGDIEAGEQFLKEIRPFIWRKYLDFAAISDVHSIKRQIHAHKGFGKIRVAGHNVKLGRGGIREVEFFTQTQQLIAGGRNPELRLRETLPTLAALVEFKWISQSACDELTEAYIFLRNVEHRIQMVHDEQTHILPEDEEALARVYHLMGYADRENFAQDLRERLETVQRHYASLFEKEPELGNDLGSLVFTGDDDHPETLETLSSLGFQRPSDTIKIIRGWHYGRYPACHTTKSRELLTEMTPDLLAALAKTENADAALFAFDRFLSNLPAGVQLFGLLRNNPHLLNLLATVMGAAPRMAKIVSKRVHVLDAVLDPAFFGDVPSNEQLVGALQVTLGEATYYEEALDRARAFVQEQQFLLGLRLLTGVISARQMGESLAVLAEAVLQELLPQVSAQLSEAHGVVPGGELAILAMGKLGGREITCSSDLDIILLYDFPEDVSASDGRRPLAPSQYYARLTQRLVTALTAPTAEGILYEVDLRLRPSGNSGPLATRLAAFADYQESEAWTWEHMALTRARVLASSSPQFTQRINAVLCDALCKSREQEKLRADVADMRGRIQKEKPTTSPWQIKQSPGGLVDIEFIAQYLQLAHAGKTPELLAQRTHDALSKAAQAGVLSAADADILIPALNLYGDLVQVLKLTVDGSFNPEEAPKGLLELLKVAGNEPQFDRLTSLLGEHQQAVRQVFERLIGQVVPDKEAAPTK